MRYLMLVNSEKSSISPFTACMYALCTSRAALPARVASTVAAAIAPSSDSVCMFVFYFLMVLVLASC